MIHAEVNKRPYTVVYIDLDNFKPINDKQGHSIGDLVLKAVVDTIQKQIRIADIFARFGGDEFAILLSDIGQEDAKRIVQRLRKTLLEKMDMHVWDVTFSIGALTFLTMPHSVEEMVRLTDELMYEVKVEGKNAIRYSVYE
jgi:diguanylate cyclase (GGDEF)-like protein